VEYLFYEMGNMTFGKQQTVTGVEKVVESPVEVASKYPTFRIMGSKHRLLPWLYDVFSTLEFETVLDAFSGSGAVSYLLKAMGKQVFSNDFLHFAYHIANGLVVNQGETLSEKELEALLNPNPNADDFIQKTFSGIFYSPQELELLDNVWANLERVVGGKKRSLALAALFRAALKAQPRGVFTVANGRARNYDDGRRDLQITLRQQIIESVQVLNEVVFADDREHMAFNNDVFELELGETPDLVYFDPPYVPRRDDNDYIKRYHFIEGLSCYWEGLEIMEETKVNKIPKKYTPFSYRREAHDAFDRLFARFSDSTLILSYSTNGYPDRDQIVDIMKRHKDSVEVKEVDHRYHFGTHSGVSADRAKVREYVLIGE
jgi:adenine-specific DNA-methyltransferase